MKISQILLVIALAAATSLGVMKAFGPQNTTQADAKKETAFERVMRTGTLRCSYLVIPPQLSRDPNTGLFSGVSADVVEEIAKRLGLKVEWTEEVNFMNVAEGFKTGRYDSFCLTSYRWAPSARVMEYTVPVYRSTTNVYVRAEDHRFDENFSSINKPEVKIVVADGGEASAFIRATDFPLSTAYSMPSNTDISLYAESVATKKADITLANPLMIMPYLVANPGKIRRVEGHAPLRGYAHALSFGKGEHDLTSMFNIVLEGMHDDGTIDKILDKYEMVPNSFVRITPPVINSAKQP